MSRKLVGFLAFVATGGGLLGGTLLSSDPVISMGVVAILCMFAVGIIGHYKQLSK